jgi:hypothetical protein
MACVYTYVHTYICIHYQVYVRASQTHASRQLPPGLSDTRVHQASSIKARARESDRALDGTAADFDPSRRPPEPHFAFPHAPLLPSTRAQPGRATQTSRLSQVGPSASCIASPRFLAHRSAPACCCCRQLAQCASNPLHTPTPLPPPLRPVLLSPRLPPDDAAVDILVRVPPPPPCSVCPRIASHPRPRHHARPSSCDKPPAHSTPALSRQRTPSIDS